MAPTPIRRLVPLGFPWEAADPFLFCVHHDDRYPAGNEALGPAASLAGRDIGQDFAGKDGWRMYHGERVPGFPRHPHRGFETVTIVRRGLVDHADSLGAAARYGEGDVQWLTAGAGIQHSEMFPLLDRDRDNPLELFQIWLNLPAADKMAPPHFSMFWADRVPLVTAADGVSVTVVAGMLGETVAPSPPPRSYASRPEGDVAIWLIRLAAGASWTLPAAASGSNRQLYCFDGSGLRIAGDAIPDRSLVVLAPAAPVALEAGGTEVQVLLLQGRPIAEPIAQYGPFVMNARAELEQAFADYQRTQFGGWPWPGPDPVHGREARFARQPDGTVEVAERETAAVSTVDALILDLLDWIGPDARPYREVMEAWRTSCPRLPVWEEANGRGFIVRSHDHGQEAVVRVSPSGKTFLRAHRPLPPPAP